MRHSKVVMTKLTGENLMTNPETKPKNDSKVKRVKSSGTTKAFGDNGGPTGTNDNYRSNFDNIFNKK